MSSSGVQTVGLRVDGATSPAEYLAAFKQVALLTARPKQAKAMVQVARRFLWQQGVDRPGRFTRPAVENYLSELADQGRSPKTLHNHRSALASFCRFLLDRGVLTADPCRSIRLAPLEQKLPRYLKPDELTTVLRIARERGIWPEVCLALCTGLRLGELIRLQWSDVDLARRVLVVRKSKSRRPRSVPLSATALEALREQRGRIDGCAQVFPARQTWRGGWRYVDRPRTANWWKRASRALQAAVPKFTSVIGTGRAWHLFRHTFASRIAQARPGVSPRKLAAWLGHRDLRTVAIYAHVGEQYDPDIEAAAPPVADSDT